MYIQEAYIIIYPLRFTPERKLTMCSKAFFYVMCSSASANMEFLCEDLHHICRALLFTSLK